jgi:aspartate dehydrogenase
MIVGIIGCGNIGTKLALFIKNKTKLDLKYLCDVNDNADKLKEKIKNVEVTDIGNLITNSDLIIESANKDVVKDILNTLDINDKEVLIMSSGGIIDNLDIFNKVKCKIHIPSGAISGLDAIKAVTEEISSLELIITKPVKGLEGSLYIIKNNIDLSEINNKKTIFEGNLKEVIEGFPKNINGAATLFLASKFKNLKVKIIADPDAKTNNHEIICKGNFGTITTKTENLPSKNPKTSYLAILSAMQVLKDISNKTKTAI